MRKVLGALRLWCARPSGGLGCRIVAVEHACPISNEFEALIRTDAFWNRYGCNPIRASKTELFFCCGL
jgi:hypothetical protein